MSPPAGCAWQRIDGALVLADLEHPQRRPLRALIDAPEVARRAAAGRGQPLSRALGLHKRPGLRILDATAGLGRDAALLARLGAEVTLCERSAVLHRLLADGLERLQAPRMRLLPCADSCDVDWRGFDAIYLDPMYPDSGKSAKPGLEMQWLRALLGHGEDFPDSWARHWSRLPCRRVLKRPPRGVALVPGRPDHRTGGGRACYAVYLPSNTSSPSR